MKDSIADEMARTREARVAKFKKGGKEPPCPFCKTPRFKRSDYIRCSNCGLNWNEGENLNRDPRVERYNAMAKAQTKFGVQTKARQ